MSYMGGNLVYILIIFVMVTAGVYLILERTLTRIIIGVVIASNGVNLLFLVASGQAGQPPFVGNDPGDMADPVPQALVLTAIVITLGMVAFLLSVAYRSWQLHGHDEVQDDIEDRRIARMAARNEPIDSESDIDLEAIASEVHDETDEAQFRADLAGSRFPGDEEGPV